MAYFCVHTTVGFSVIQQRTCVTYTGDAIRANTPLNGFQCLNSMQCMCIWQSNRLVLSYSCIYTTQGFSVDQQFTYDNESDAGSCISVWILLRDFHWISSVNYGNVSGAVGSIPASIPLKDVSMKQQLYMRMYQILVVVFLYQYYSGIFSESAVYIWQCMRCCWWYFCIYTTRRFFSESAVIYRNVSDAGRGILVCNYIYHWRIVSVSVVYIWECNLICCL